MCLIIWKYSALVYYYACSNYVLSFVVVPPGPPTDILVSTTSTEANVTWKAPLFIGELFSKGKFIVGQFCVIIVQLKFFDLFSSDHVSLSFIQVLPRAMYVQKLYDFIVSQGLT